MTELAPLEPGGNETDEAERLKSITVAGIVIERVTEPPVPVTVTL